MYSRCRGLYTEHRFPKGKGAWKTRNDTTQHNWTLPKPGLIVIPHIQYSLTGNVHPSENPAERHSKIHFGQQVRFISVKAECAPYHHMMPSCHHVTPSCDNVIPDPPAGLTPAPPKVQHDHNDDRCRTP